MPINFDKYFGNSPSNSTGGSAVKTKSKINFSKYFSYNPAIDNPGFADEQATAELGRPTPPSIPELTPDSYRILKGDLPFDQPTADTLRAVKGDSTLDDAMRAVHGDTGMPSELWGLGALDAKLNPIVEGWLNSNPVTAFLHRTSQQGANLIANGGEQLPGQNLASTGNGFADATADMLSYAALPLNPGAGLYRAGQNVAAQTLSKFAPNVGAAANKFLTGVAAQTSLGLGMGAQKAGVNSLDNPDYTFGQGVKDTALEGLYFGAGDAALRGLGMGIKAGANKLGLTDWARNLLGRGANAVEDVTAMPTGQLALPAPQPIAGLLPAPAETNFIAGFTEKAVPRKFTPADPAEQLNRVLEEIKPEVLKATQEVKVPALESKKAMIDYIAEAFPGVSRNEIRKLDMQGLHDLTLQAARERQVPSVIEAARQAAAKRGVNLDNLMDQATNKPSFTQQAKPIAERNRLAQAAGVMDRPKVGRGPTEKVPYVEPTAKTVQQVMERVQQAKAPVQSKPAIETTPETIVRPAQSAPVVPPKRPTVPPNNVQGGMKERGFNRTVRTSEQTTEQVADALTQNAGRFKQRSHKQLREEANRIIDRVGEEKAATDLLGKRKMSDLDMTVAQILAKRLQSRGDEASLNKALDIIAKTGKGGTELGQAISALQQWNKMDKEGALLLGTRIVNKGKPLDEFRSLTAEEAKPLTAAAAKYQQVEAAKSLADKVMEIVAKKQPGEKLSEAELSTIREFQKQVNNIDSKVKQFLPKDKKKPDSVIKEVSQIPPKDRKRDQVVSLLEAKAEKARKSLARKRNIGFAQQIETPAIIDYATIGAYHFANKIVKLADFTEAMVKEFGEGFRPVASKVYNKAVNIFRKENGLPTTEELERVTKAALKRGEIDGELADQMKAWASEIGFMADEFKKEATQDLQLAMKALQKSTLGHKISTVQTADMLLSLPTFLRNLGGNGGMIVLDKIDKITKVPLDWTLSKLTGNERTVYFLPGNQERMWKNFITGTKSGWKGTNPDGALSNSDMYPNAFGDKNPLKYLEKSLGASLKGPDYAAYKRAYGETLQTYAINLGKQQGLSGKALKKAIPDLTKQLDEEIYRIADEAGKYATFQDNTVLSEMFTGVKHLLNKPSKLVGLEGWGLGDIVLKFAHTPANIIMRSIDYSPIGILRGLYLISKPLVKRGSFNQREAVNAISRAITGTVGLTGLGYYLADLGILTGSPSSDIDVRELERKIGRGDYRVNLSALERWLTGGLNREDALFKQGDTLVNYGWLAPAAMSLAMGVNANKEVSNKKKGETKTTTKAAFDAISGSLKVIFEQPLLQGLQNLVSVDTKQENWLGKKALDLVKGVPASFIPAVVNQARTYSDNTARSTISTDSMEQILNQMKNRIPGLSRTLPVSYDTLGKPKEQIQGGKEYTTNQFLNSFVNPARVTKFTLTDEAKMVLDLMENSGESKVVPRYVDKYFMVKGKKVDLSPQQYEKLQRTTGQYVTDMIKKKQIYLTNPSVKTESKVSAVYDILNEAGTKARDELKKEMGLPRK